MHMNNVFTADEHDLVIELMNLGVGRAAHALSQLVGDEVLLSVPKLNFIPIGSAQESFHAELPQYLAGVMQDFSGFMNGRAALLFPEARSFELLDAMLGEDISSYQGAEFEEEALAELGNILLNSCLATIANQLNRSILTDIPQAFSTNADDLSGKLNLTDATYADSLLMLVNIDFSLRKRELQGHLIFLIDLRSEEPFIAALKAYIGDLV